MQKRVYNAHSNLQKPGIMLREVFKDIARGQDLAIRLTIRDINQTVAEPFLTQGAAWAESPKALAETVDVVITCLPSPAVVSTVMEADDGVLAAKEISHYYFNSMCYSMR